MINRMRSTSSWVGSPVVVAPPGAGGFGLGAFGGGLPTAATAASQLCVALKPFPARSIEESSP